MLSTQFDKVNKIWYGLKHEYHFEKHTSLGQIVMDKLTSADPNRILQIDSDSGKKQTKNEIRILSVRCAQNLLKLGCKPHDRIGIIARNNHNLTPLLFASLAIGAPFSPLDVSCEKENIFHIFRRTKPSFIFCDTDVVQKVEEVGREIGLNFQIFTVNGSLDGFQLIDELLTETGTEDTFACSKIEDSYEHIGIIACSSGSTGIPKSICLSHAQLSDYFLRRYDEKELITLNFNSLNWITGTWSILSSAISNHTRLITSQPFSPHLFFSLVEKYKIQMFLAPPLQLLACIKSDAIESADLSTILLCFPIGAPLPHILASNIQKYMPQVTLITMYGMTECGGNITMTSSNDLDTHPNSVGRLVLNARVKIVDENTGLNCGIGEQGEIHVKLNFPFLGYYGVEEATRDALHTDGVFITGDLGYFDEDGYLYIVGRKKEIFKNRGHKISPIEIEHIVMKHSGVRSVCVVGVSDELKLSELPAAIVVKNKQHSVSEDEIYKLVADHLASYKYLDGGIYFVAELPMTPSGKVIRSAVKKIALDLFLNQ